MRRFLVLQSVFLANDFSEEEMSEPVIDFDTRAQADNWISEQPDPTLFTIEDQFPQDDLVFDEHDFRGYEDREDDRYDDDFSGDGDAD